MDTYPNKERKSRRRIDIHKVGLAVMGSDIVQNVETKGLVPTSSCLSAKVPDACVELKVFELLPGDRGLRWDTKKQYQENRCGKQRNSN